MKRLMVIAFGGHQLAPIHSGNPGIEEQFARTRQTARLLGAFMASNPDSSYVISHGNGPQVGNIETAFESSKDTYSIPLFIAGAMSQGQIAYMIQEAVMDATGIRCAGIVTRVLVDARDPAFNNPTKYIGRCYLKKEIMKWRVMGKRERLKGRLEYVVRDKGIYRLFSGNIESGAYRKVVASPKPVAIVEFDAITSLLDSGIIPITVGGGGIPVIMRRKRHVGIEAVIDKDLASACLSVKLRKHYAVPVSLIILMNEDAVYEGFGTPQCKRIPAMTVRSARSRIANGEFPAGSMLPKIEAATMAIKGGVDSVFITNPLSLRKAYERKAGTIITK